MRQNSKAGELAPVRVVISLDLFAGGRGQTFPSHVGQVFGQPPRVTVFLKPIHNIVRNTKPLLLGQPLPKSSDKFTSACKQPRSRSMRSWWHLVAV